MQKDNTTSVLALFVKKLGIPVTRQTISDELEKHPAYNSLLAFSDVLGRWQVSNAAYNLTFEQLAEVPLPFIAFISRKDFALVTQLDGETATLSNERWNNKILPVNELKKIYSGSILIAEKNEHSGEPDYEQKHKKEVINNLRLPVFLTGAAILLIGFLLLHSSYLTDLTLPIALLTLFKTIGLTSSILLLIQSMDANNPLIQKLCGDDNKNCNAILSSKAAKVNEYLTWSEVGFFYFAGTWLTLLFNSGNIAVLQMLAILNILSLPYTLYSIYYQWRVAKQWCIFCCTTQAVLWLEFFTFLPSLTGKLQIPDLAGWSALLIAMAAPILAWIFLKTYLLQAKQLAPLKAQLRRFKYNTELFDKMLNDEAKYTLPAEENSLIIGNREAENIITIVANPYCQPCAKAHKALDWLDNRDDIKLQIIFSTSNNENDKKTEVAAHLLAIQNTGDAITVKKAMHDWYEQKQKNYDAWANSYPVEKSPATHQQLEKQKEWCKLAEITGTPTLFVNGRRLPKSYQPEDLKYFI